MATAALRQIACLTDMWKELEALMKEGIKNGELMLLVSRTSAGKSMLSENLAREMRLTERVTIESSKQTTGKHHDAEIHKGKDKG